MVEENFHKVRRGNKESVLQTWMYQFSKPFTRITHTARWTGSSSFTEKCNKRVLAAAVLLS